MISKEEIEHLKDLARVEFGKAETEKLAKDLGEILGYVDELKEVDVTGVPEMTHAVEGMKNVFRKDDSGDSPRSGAPENYNTPDLTGAFPEKEKKYLKVQSIL